MLEITNWNVFELKESVIACRNAMRLTPAEYTEEEFNKSLPRAIALAKCGGGYKAGKYTSDWCLDYEFENGDYKTTFADNPVDACYNMIIKLNELKML